MIGMWGPARARRAPGRHRGRRLGRGVPVSHGPRRSRSAGADVTAQRITYVGELGFELYVAPECGRAGVGRAARGRRAGTASRPPATARSTRCGIEKGYRYMGTDLTAGDTPYEAGLGFCVALDKGDVQRPRRRWPAGRRPGAADPHAARWRPPVPEPVYGGEAVHAGGEVVGRVRSARFGPRSAATSALRLSPGGDRPGATASRSRCSASWSAPRSPRTCSSTRRTNGSSPSPPPRRERLRAARSDLQRRSARMPPRSLP